MTLRTFAFGLGGAGLAALVCLTPARANDDLESKLKAIDTNGDGKISSDEFLAGSHAKFEKMDANSDGQVTVSEMDTAQEQAMAKSGKANQVPMSSSVKITLMDTNGDGEVSVDEYASGSKVLFDKIDANGDGFLTRAELKALHQKMTAKAPRP